MAERECAYSYPVIVEGEWGGKLPKNLRYKFTSYFQSRKRSGGGECKIIHEEPAREDQITVCFAAENVRQSVLNRTHELDVSEGKKIKLAVFLPVVAAAAEKEPLREADPEKKSVEAEEPQQPSSIVLNHPDHVGEEQVTREDFSVMVVPAGGEEIEIEFLEMYFENRRSGGGPVKACVKEGHQFIVTFENEADAERVLQRKDHTVKKVALHVSKHKPEVQVALPMSSSLVVIENVGETTEQNILMILIENVSDLSEEEGEFSVEMVPEANAAVITFVKDVETAQFIKKFNQYHRSKGLNLSAHLLEITKSILVENIPPDIPKNYILVYFESKKHGGGPVLDADYVPKEHSAVVTFQDAKDLYSVLNQKHLFNGVQVLVYPYYKSLGTALYGKERPQMKMPELSRVVLDPFLWQFLQRNPLLCDEIRDQMAHHYCELQWPSRDSEHPEITVCPLRALLKQSRSLVKTWNEDVAANLTQILSKQKVARCSMEAEVWEAIRNSMVSKDIAIFPDMPKGIVALVGAAEVVDAAEQKMEPLIQKAVKKIERERQIMEKTVSIVPGKYTVLSNAGLLERIRLEYPELKISYDVSKGCICLCGVAAEVFKTKSDILESLSSMAQKSVDVPPYILLFLQYVDNEPLSQLLFRDKNINAFYELKGEAVLLLGGTSQDLTRAEEEMRKDLSFRCIELEDKLVVKMKKWDELTRSLYKAYNCSSATIIIHELEEQIVVAGYSHVVNDVNQKLADFVDTNTHIQKILVTKSAVVTRFVEQEMSNKWLALSERGVAINFGKQNRRKIFLEGPKREVLEGHQLFQSILSSLHTTVAMVDRIGAKTFFRQQEHLYVPVAKQKFRCLVMLQEGPESDGEESRSEGRGQQCCEVKLRGNIVVTVNKGDLTHFPVDVIVNAANEELKHIGGLADALLRVAGPQLQKECDDLVATRGSLRPGGATITGAWNLPCKQVIHAVGPRWDGNKKEKCIQLLKNAVRLSLQLAETYNHGSIAIPAISSGVFGFPLKQCAHSIVTAIKETLEDVAENGSLKQIHLVDCRDETVQAFTEAVNELLGSKGLPSKANSKRLSTSKDKMNRVVESRREEQTVITTEGLKIILQKKGIEDATTDVIVNSVSKDLELKHGPLSKALVNKAGPELQMELTEQGQGKNLKKGCVLKTSGYSLSCHTVLHVLLPHWNQGQNAEEKILRDVVVECLTTTEQLSWNSITIPAIGTGNLGFPKPLVAELMFDEVFKFSQKQKTKSLKEVHFVLHPSDTSSIKAFTDELNSRQNLIRTGFKVVPDNVQQSQGVHKMQIGPIKLQVECGDITQEATDAIVNITNDTFNLCAGVSKAILEGAGPEMAKECADLASQPHKNLICTKPGKLKCKSAIHLVAHSDTKAQVTKALQECEQKQFTSVAFPAIGTGQAGLDPAKVADDMIDAIVDFANNTSTTVVKNIKIIIFQKHLLNVFCTSMQRKEGAAPKPDEQAPKSILSTIKGIFGYIMPAPKTKQKPSLSLEKTVEPAIFQICGDNQSNVEAAAKWIKDLILEEQREMTFSDACIASFGEREWEQLRSLQEKLNIGIELECGPNPFLRIHGVSKDVWTAVEEVQRIMKRVREDREEQSRADLIGTVVEWQYEDQGQFRAFDALTNMRIESAAQHQGQHGINIGNKRYTVDPSNLCATDAQGTKIKLRRLAKLEDAALPEEWEDMQRMRVKVVELNKETEEYKKVKTMFCQTCNAFKIEKIERIQNPFYWQAYQVKKQEMDNKNGNTKNERLLFHGTGGSSLTLINTKGFNRSYAGMHAAAYGNGTYFAVGAKYSACDTYSKPDANGKKYMYLARVLVGDYCVGSQGLIVPGSKSTMDPTDLYDSVTDNVANPSLFVIFNDIQAYPEYLITFKK